MCLWCVYKAHVSVLTFSMNRKYGTPTVVGATSAFYAVKTGRRLYAFMINNVIATTELFAIVYETTARIEIS